MMKEQIKTALSQVAEEVLERLAFILSFPAADRGVPSTNRGLLDRNTSITACVSFDGPFKGMVAVVISKESLPELAGNMLGVDNSETSSEQQKDAVKELINVICGNLLPVLSGKRAIFDVGTPQITKNPFDEKDLMAISKLSLETGDCDLYFFVHGAIPQGSIRENINERPKPLETDDWAQFSVDDIEDF